MNSRQCVALIVASVIALVMLGGASPHAGESQTEYGVRSAVRFLLAAVPVAGAAQVADPGSIVGLWKDELGAKITISFEAGELRLDATTKDGEKFVVSDISFDGTKLTSTWVFPATGWTSHHAMSVADRNTMRGTLKTRTYDGWDMWRRIVPLRDLSEWPLGASLRDVERSGRYACGVSKQVTLGQTVCEARTQGAIVIRPAADRHAVVNLYFFDEKLSTVVALMPPIAHVLVLHDLRESYGPGRSLPVPPQDEGNAVNEWTDGPVFAQLHKTSKMTMLFVSSRDAAAKGRKLREQANPAQR
jgi:hypothetical protein